jgi:hypothetical protein
MRILACIVLMIWVMPTFAQQPPASQGMLLPLQDRSGDPDLARRVTEMLQAELGLTVQLLPSDGLRDEMRRLRIRDAGDISPQEIRQLAEKFGVDWFVSATLHAARETPEPEFALSAWALRVEENNLAWAGFQSLAGLSTRRSLDRNRIYDLEPLAGLVVRRLMADLRRTVEGAALGPVRAPSDRLGFVLEPLAAEQLGVVAVVPFESITDWNPSESGEMITALAHATLFRNGAVVVHPGLVNAILRRRGVFMRGELDPLARAALQVGGHADHILTGTVETYDSPASIEPNPHVAFSARLVDVESGRIVWISGQERKGWDQAGLFEQGKVYDAGSLAETMMQSLMMGFLQAPDSVKP